MELTLDMTKRYTYADYLTWLDDVRRELIDGKKASVHIFDEYLIDLHDIFKD